jgi:hypothetical protein
MDTIKRLRTWMLAPITARIAVVGNGPVDPSQAAPIDSHSMVVRFNGCWHYGTSGFKTDVLVLSNSGGSGKHLAYAADAIVPQALASARRFWFPKPPEAISDGDYTRDLIANRAGGRPWLVFGAAVYRDAEQALIEAGASCHCVPSSGLLALCYIRRTYWWPRVTLFGFTHHGWEGHAWDAERQLIDGWGFERGASSPAPEFAGPDPARP